MYMCGCVFACFTYSSFTWETCCSIGTTFWIGTNTHTHTHTYTVIQTHTTGAHCTLTYHSHVHNILARKLSSWSHGLVESVNYHTSTNTPSPKTITFIIHTLHCHSHTLPSTFIIFAICIGNIYIYIYKINHMYIIYLLKNTIFTFDFISSVQNTFIDQTFAQP